MTFLTRFGMVFDIIAKVNISIKKNNKVPNYSGMSIVCRVTFSSFYLCVYLHN